MHTVAIALGSNLGDSFQNIESALRLLEAPEHLQKLDGIENGLFTITVVDTSFLYRTAPMYVIDQPPFINCACIIETNLPPLPLLRFLKYIESTIGRVPSVRNGPRAIDLDIILYGTSVIDTRQPSGLGDLDGQLVVPHPGLEQREFVLRPLCDMIPQYIHPVHRKSMSTLLATLPQEDPSMCKVVPFPRYPPSPSSTDLAPPTLTHWTYPVSLTKRQQGGKHKTQLMAALNATPDSFSDGAVNNTLEAAAQYAIQSVESGATIIDVGGYSTKPGASFVSADEEENRVVPIIKALRNMGSLGSVDQGNSGIEDRAGGVLISVDTFRWEVAKASILAGANCINDVYAFTGKDDSYPETNHEEAEACMTSMKNIARCFAVPVVLMHSRGDAGQHKNYEMYDYGEVGGSGVIEGVRVELGGKVDRIVKGRGGVRRWSVIVDPGVGFSKTVKGNLSVLREASSIVADLDIGTGEHRRRNPLQGFPLLIGTSRKSFLGTIVAQGPTGRSTEAKDRVWATAAAVACGVQQGALVIRAHDTKEMSDVISVSDELWG